MEKIVSQKTFKNVLVSTLVLVIVLELSMKMLVKGYRPMIEQVIDFVIDNPNRTLIALGISLAAAVGVYILQANTKDDSKQE